VFSSDVSESFFATMRIPILRGREFQDSDRADTPPVAIVNERLASHYWPGQDAVGRRFHLGGAMGPLVQIVGVAQTSKYFWIAEPPLDFVYLPYTQDRHTTMTILVQSAAPDSAALAPVLREVIRALDPAIATYDARTMDNFYEQRAVKTPNMIAQSVATLGTMGLVLAMTGLYALIAYSVSRRAREIGIRLAIGADPRHVIRMVLHQGLLLGGAGVAIGLVLSFVACQTLTSVVFVASFRHLDYEVFPGFSIPLLVLTLLAAYVPARRASLIDPMRTLREE
jgi:hypothetical protein